MPKYRAVPNDMDWYTLPLQCWRNRDLKALRLPPLHPFPMFEKLFSGAAADPEYDPSLSSTQAVYHLIQNGGYTTTQAYIDGISMLGPNAFYQLQYSSECWDSIGNSNYHALVAS